MKDAAREAQEEDGKNTDGKRKKKVAPKRATKKLKPESLAHQPSEPPVQGEAASGSKPPEVVTEPAKVDEEVKEEAKDSNVPSPKKAPIKKRGQVSAEDLLTLWKTKEPQSSCCIQNFGMCGNLELKYMILYQTLHWS